MSVKRARLGYPKVKEEAAENVEKQREAELFLDNPVWKTAAGELRRTYLDLFLACPETDDKQRYRLQIALNMIDMVESHVVLAHSHAEAEVRRVIKKDLKTSKSLFRR